ncbi:uncharacterized protein LACBIDRAFT_299140 [Laccaria bicolor S238N-H82]|uniref:Predicted protein n=1 Tax=Laccaria bicolor (strain S238N-H82 / ATCC MYA-4686) TaxID=486041 RepID=B0DE58_LACBS|nr:uncharacterized protein LACBIDRAFT_299140 [Laccaria bicolor S238N-H82]EDR07332.1 predicted protein [Laccaria bicolor S238N-H82]|eukprot:XP_001882263.1 predicted protein [Laccaria bicolor S238N-H82]
MEPPGCSFQPLMKPREGSEQPQRGWKPPPLDHGSQPLMTPPDRGLLPTTPARCPAYRRRPFGNSDDELDQYDDDDDDYDDYDYIDDSETDSSDYIWEPRSSKQRKSPLKKTLLTCLPGPSAPQPKLPIVHCNGQSTSGNPNPAVTSGQISQARGRRPYQRYVLGPFPFPSAWVVEVQQSPNLLQALESSPSQPEDHVSYSSTRIPL